MQPAHWETDDSSSSMRESLKYSNIHRVRLHLVPGFSLLDSSGTGNCSLNGKQGFKQHCASPVHVVPGCNQRRHQADNFPRNPAFPSNQALLQRRQTDAPAQARRRMRFHWSKLEPIHCAGSKEFKHKRTCFKVIPVILHPATDGLCAGAKIVVQQIAESRVSRHRSYRMQLKRRGLRPTRPCTQYLLACRDEASRKSSPMLFPMSRTSG